MKTFKDNEDRTWTVKVNISTVKRVKSLLGINIFDAIEKDLIARLVTDTILLVDVLYVICKPEAEQKNVSDEQFGEGLAGDAITAATTALLEELVDFFPEAKRQVLQKAVGKYRKVENLAIEMAMKYLDSRETEKKIEAELRNISDSSGSLPELSESIPTL